MVILDADVLGSKMEGHFAGLDYRERVDCLLCTLEGVLLSYMSFTAMWNFPSPPHVL